MKTNSIKIILLLFLVIVGFCLSACSTESTERKPSSSYTYTMYLDGGFDHKFGKTITKSSAEWEDGSVIYLQFMKESYLVQGYATYNNADDTWTVETDEELYETVEDECEAYFFSGAESSTALKVYLTDETAIYGDKMATYSLEGQVLTVRAYMTPLTSRIRFLGSPYSMVSLMGITTFSTYNLTLNTFTEYSDIKRISLDENGDSGYIHAVFTDSESREIVFFDEGKRAFQRNFTANVLAVGTSGFINVPSLESMSGWKVVNVDNMQEVTLPVFGDVSVLEVKSKSVKLSAKISDCGNGNLLKMGFICSTNSKPSFENGRDCPCKPSQDVLVRIRSLEPETRYYLQAYVVNERGISYGSTMRFVTISEEDEGASMHYDDYGDDENWGGDSPVEDDLGKDDYPDDENWGGDPPAEDDLGKDGYPEAEDWN